MSPGSLPPLLCQTGQQFFLFSSAGGPCTVPFQSGEGAVGNANQQHARFFSANSRPVNKTVFVIIYFSFLIDRHGCLLEN